MEIPNNNNLKKRDSDHVKIVNYLKNNNGIKLKDLGDDLIINLPTRLSHKYVFSWDNIPGRENERLINYLKLYFGTDWVKAEKIEKIDNGKVIRISANKNSLSLSLNDERNKVNLKIDDGELRKLNAKIENGKLNIYINGPTIETVISGKYQQYDILCFNNKDKDIVIIEVKSETADYKTFGQILYYIDQVEKIDLPYLPGVNTVQGIILAKEIDSSLKQLVNKYKNTIPKINLKKYDWVGDNLEITDIILSNDI